MKKELKKSKGKKLELRSETVLKWQVGAISDGEGAVASPTRCTQCFCPSKDYTTYQAEAE